MMKYMNPDLIIRSRSENEDVADEACVQWEQAIKAYNSRIETVRPQLTESIRQFLDTICLHDAHFVRVVLSPGQRKLSLLLEEHGHENGPNRSKFVLTYYILSAPKIVRHPGQLTVDEADWRWVLYDEIDLYQTDLIRAYTHSLLFTGGWELQLLFSDMKVIQNVQVFDADEMSEISVECPELAETCQ
jgi:hypothetical protein